MNNKYCNKNIGLIGYGNFGKLVVKHLNRYFDFYIYDSYISDEISKTGINFCSIEEVIDRDILIIAIPYVGFKKFIEEYGSKIPKNTIVIDVLSIKVKAIELMKKHLNKDVEIFATHPLFGPESTKDGLGGKKIAVFPVRTTRANEIIEFLSNKLRLQIIHTTAQEHDKQMAYIQALSHFISKALVQFDLPIYEDQQTKTYEYLQSAKNIVKNDSDDLFYTIQNENPYAYEIREEFLQVLESIHKSINEH